MQAFDKPYWNLMQVLAWVYLGDRSAVEYVAEDDEKQRTIREKVRLPDGRTEWIDKDVGPPSPVWLDVRAGFNGGAAFPDYKSAKKAILDELIAGNLTCYALRNNDGDLQEVPALHWPELDFYWDRDRPYAGSKDFLRPNATRWHGLRFRREEILRVWPDPLSNANSDSSELAYHWLSYDRLELGIVISIARGATSADCPAPDGGEWHARFKAVKAVIDDNELTATLRGASANVAAIVRLADLLAFAHLHLGAEWDWLREFCQRWAAVRGESLEHLSGQSTPISSPAEPPSQIARTGAQERAKRRGGKKPGAYFPRLRRFLEWYHANRDGGLQAPTLKQLAADARKRLEQDGVTDVPKSRSAFEAAIKKIKADILARD